MEQTTEELQVVTPVIRKSKKPKQVLAYQFMPNDQCYYSGNKEPKEINVYCPEHLLQISIEDGKKRYKERFISVEKDLTTNTLQSKMLEEDVEVEETSEQIKARILAGVNNE